MTSPQETLSGLWSLAGLRPNALGAVTLTGAEPVLPSSFRVGTAAQASIAASALAAAEIFRLRTRQRQEVAVDMRHAAAEFRSERHLRLDGKPPPDPWDSIAGTYRCGDARWVRLHTNFPHHRDGVLRILNVAQDRQAVAVALQNWQAEVFETACAEAGLVVTMMRSFSEWDAHPQGQAVATLPPLVMERIGDAPVRPMSSGVERPLSGLRVLELTRVIAGPVAGRTLAAHGADVLLITAPHLPAIAPLVMDTGRGKLSAQLDLRDPATRERLRGLIAGADVFLQGYRPGAIAGHGFSPAEIAAIRPGIVCVSLSAYGLAGPWSGRRGFDSVVLTASGFNHAEMEAAEDDKPRPLPCQAIDHASGYLLALGAMAGLMKRATEGGSWHARVSLATTGRWLRGLGRVEGGLACPDPTQKEIVDLLEEAESGFGRLTSVRDAARLSATPPHWARPSVPLGTHEPVWP